MRTPNDTTGTITLAIVAVLALGACGRARERATTDTSAGAVAPGAAQQDTTHRDTSGMAGMPGMRGMMGAQMGAMMDSMMTRMSMMDTMSAAQMMEMLPMHRQMVGNMLARMNSEMRRTNLTADAAWTATVDSLRQDLVRMPELSPEELKAMMPAHHARMTRLMEMHRSMMGRKRR